MNSDNHQFLIALGSNISLGETLPLGIIKRAIIELVKTDINLVSVSYTHLTMPTTPYV